MKPNSWSLNITTNWFIPGNGPIGQSPHIPGQTVLMAMSVFSLPFSISWITDCS
jgi:hypothetical protein